VELLGLKGHPHCREVEQAAETHVLEETILTGIYSR
jgi:hypothetical protein